MAPAAKGRLLQQKADVLNEIGRAFERACEHAQKATKLLILLALLEKPLRPWRLEKPIVWCDSRSVSQSASGSDS
jgi:hypothetical protein